LNENKTMKKIDFDLLSFKMAYDYNLSDVQRKELEADIEHGLMLCKNVYENSDRTKHIVKFAGHERLNNERYFFIQYQVNYNTNEIGIIEFREMNFNDYAKEVCDAYNKVTLND